ncbi:MAG: 6-pyruvoyl trahydropterin synthase family protein [Bacteroidales bacterium]
MPNTKIRITKEFRFEAAHALWGYDGACRNIHGHSYILYVTLLGEPETDPDHPKFGMVMDFSVLKKIVYDQIVEPFDHALMVRKGTPHSDLARTSGLVGKLLELEYQPTCENMVSDFATRIARNLPQGIMLHSLRLHETATAYAEWYAEDNA